MDTPTLIRMAIEVRQQAYAPYSHFAVGASLLTEDGSVFSGCNVENLSFGLTQCAERTAVCAAVAAGHRKFQRVVIVSDSKDPVSPCGACRQVMAEFAPALQILSVNLQGDQFESSLDKLLPRASTGILG